MTFSHAMEKANGHTSGFDYFRIILATEILIWHSLLMAYGREAQDQFWAGPYRAWPALILPMFFSLSGFLVAGSLFRSKTIVRFLLLRALRIFPALAVLVLITACVLGPLETTYSFRDYFADPRFNEYLWTAVGDVHDILPGVFETNPYPNSVNGQLWFIPVELKCYLILTVLAILGVCGRRTVFLVLLMLAQVAFGARALFGTAPTWAGVPQNIMMLCFFFGIAIYLYRDRLRANGRMAIAALIIGVLLIYLPRGSYFIAAPVAYLTVYLGLFNPKKFLLVRSGDYSYGVYLFAFPIQQVVASLGGWADHWYVNLAISLPLCYGAAILSWHLLEKHVLGLRHHIQAVDVFVARLVSPAHSKLADALVFVAKGDRKK